MAVEIEVKRLLVRHNSEVSHTMVEQMVYRQTEAVYNLKAQSHIHHSVQPVSNQDLKCHKYPKGRLP